MVQPDRPVPVPVRQTPTKPAFPRTSLRNRWPDRLPASLPPWEPPPHIATQGCSKAVKSDAAKDLRPPDEQTHLIGELCRTHMGREKT